MFTIHDIIALAVRLEENGQRVYQKAAKAADDPEIRELLELLADEENSHARWFSDLKETLGRDDDHHILGEMSRSLSDDFFADQVFSLKDVDLSTIRTIEELIETAIGFEKDSILFYKMLAPFISEEKTSETLDRIIHEENTHIEKLKDIFPNIARTAR